MESTSMARLLKKVFAFRKPGTRGEQQRVLVRGKVIMLTSAQARRYRKLRRAPVMFDN